MKLDYTQIEDIFVSGIDYSDRHDFCDAYIESAWYKGRVMTEEELEVLNQDNCFVHESLMKQLY